MMFADRAWPVEVPRTTTRLLGTFDRLRFRRGTVLGVLDVASWVAAIVLATTARYALSLPERAIVGMLVLAAVASLLMVAIGALFGLHRGRFVVGSVDEAVALVRCNAVITVVLIGGNLAVDRHLAPFTATISAPLFATFLAFAPRMLYRFVYDDTRSPDPASSRRVIVFGAGDAGRQITTALLREPSSALLPVALVDDDPRKSNLSIMGVRVLGTREAIPRIAKSLRADTLLVAVPSGEPELKLELATVAAECDLDVRILPPVSELIEQNVGIGDIREVTEHDLLGRPQVEVDIDGIAGYLRDRVVLVTGAGGSIGSEICRMVRRFAPRALVMLDRDESALHAVQLSLEGKALLSDPNIVVADIRDTARMIEVMETHRPDVVFHAAALKHLPLLELHPEEGVKTNVWGTQNVVSAALDAGCKRFVNISTDKAADPVSVLGYTKRLAERITADAADASGLPYLSVRFGNVLGSRGSVLPTFRAQIDAGGPVTVTHPDVTRYFMTVEEAVRLVVQAGAIGEPGEVLVLDMGSPVRIDDVARRLIARSGRKIEIQYTGLRPGEKLHEQLLSVDEVATTRAHPMIMHTRVAPIAPSKVITLDLEELRRHATAGDDGLGEVGGTTNGALRAGGSS
jgi:FlaA1/EpsC-like NDP-sugar epimerase